jgi:hypothetical protein
MSMPAAAPARGWGTPYPARFVLFVTLKPQEPHLALLVNISRASNFFVLVLCPVLVLRATYVSYHSFRARFNAYYEGQEALKAGAGTPATAEELTAFKSEHPEASRQLMAMRSVGFASLSALALGTVGGGAWSFRRGGHPAYLAVGAILGGATAAFLVDDVTTWVFGTYTFDQTATSHFYGDWITKRRAEAAGSSASQR